MSYIDLHCHVLPGLDDGPPTLEAAIALAEGLAALGFAVLHPTPHQKARAWAPDAAAREQAATELRAGLQGAPVIEVPAGENMWDELFLERADDLSFPTYATGRAFLVEIMAEMPPPRMIEHLYRFRLAGKLPVLAHVERYNLARDENKLDEVGRHAALLVNLSSLGGMAGWRVRGIARQLVKRRAVAAVSTDAHGEPDLSWGESGLRWIRETMGDEAVVQLLVEGPRRILAGEIPEW